MDQYKKRIVFMTHDNHLFFTIPFIHMTFVQTPQFLSNQLQFTFGVEFLIKHSAKIAPRLNIDAISL